MRGKLPKPGTPEWDEELEFFRSSTVSGRMARSVALGYINSESYSNAMRRRGAYLSVPISPREKFTKAPVITRPSLVIFDAQLPFHDAGFLDNLLELAVAWGVKQGVSGGDLLNMTAFSMFFEKPEDKVWSKEREIAIGVMSSMQSAVEEWELVLGNHEIFLLKRLAEQIGHEDILRLLDRPKGFTATDYYYCKVHFGGSLWRITHPRNVSVIHGRIPTALCNKYHCNVASGHGHLAGMNPDYSGKYYACDVGVTCDPARLDYVMMRDCTRPAQCQGALILMLGDDGKCHPYHIYPDADFKALKRLYK